MVRTKAGFRGGLRRLQTIVAAALCAPGAAFAALEYNFQPPVTPVAQQIIDLHSLIFWICVVIFVGVFGVMFYSIFKHRKSVGHVAEQFHENTTVEIIWTVIPFLILLFMAFPATKTILAMKDTSAPDMTVKVTGYQWKWNYDYLQEGFGFYSNLATPAAQIENQAPKGEHYLLEVDQPMVVPVDTKVRLLITAGDVIHSWWMPAFGVKQDAIPGFVRDTWFRAEKVGTYRGQCAELCGKEHGFMPIVVEVKSKEDYASWVADQKAKAATAADDPNKVWEMKDLRRARREGVCGQLRGLSSGVGEGRAAGVSAARRLEGRQRSEDRADQDRAQRGDARRQADGDACLEAALRHRSRVGHHLHAQQLGQPHRRDGAARRSQGRPPVVPDRFVLEIRR